MDLRSLLFAAFLFLELAYGQLEELQYDMFRTKKYCGSHLAQALSAICKGNYNTYYKNQDMYQKKSYWDPQYVADMPTDTPRISVSETIGGYIVNEQLQEEKKTTNARRLQRVLRKIVHSRGTFLILRSAL
ncbi:hypothetical protein NQ317_006050 [Molorchus minor]|uniref:Insulin-like domain-containing protein n=1 Tax=Molorchus minor TaxID=1323400 RepID=A0ABQ9K1T4_9CUCU|nr:hypothetical protein NQ317_006050 [Molorchus minor]